MRDSTEKARQAIMLWAVALGMLWMLWPPALGLPQLWAVVAVSVLVNVLQPAYALTARAEGREDRGTFVQIVGSIYATQVGTLIELVVRKPALRFDTVAWGVPGQRIVQDGPYRWIRHPSYTGAWLTFVTSCVLLGSRVAAGLAAIALAAGFARRISHEERLLTERCPGYRAYAARTGALLPRVW